MRGRRPAGRIRLVQPDLPAILMTAFPEVLKSSVKIQGYLTKPFDNLASVVEAVERALAFGVLMRHGPAARGPTGAVAK